MNRVSARSVGHVIGGLVAGALAGTIGTVAHRAVMGDRELPYGIVLALLATVLLGVCMRAWAGFTALVAYGVAFAAAIQAFSLFRPGGDILIPDQAIGLVWILGGMALVALTFFLPRSWFSDVPVRSNTPADGQPPPTGARSVESGLE